MNEKLKAAMGKVAEFAKNASEATDAATFRLEIEKAGRLLDQVEKHSEKMEEAEAAEQACADALDAYAKQSAAKKGKGK